MIDFLFPTLINTSVFPCSLDPKSPIEKIKRTIGKVFISILEQFPCAFVKSESCRKSVAFYYRNLLVRNDGSGSLGPAMEKLCIQGIILLRGLVRNPVFHKDSYDWRGNYVFELGVHASKSGVENSELIVECQKIIDSEILSNPFIQELSSLILQKFLILNAPEFSQMIESPEAFLAESTESSWQFNLTRCSETLLQDLLIRYKDLLAVLLADLFKSAVSAPLDESTIIMKYSVYGAASSCASDLAESINMDSMLSQYLIPEFLSITENSGARSISKFCTIRLRFAQLLGAWVDVQMGQEIRLKVYECLIHMISPSEPFMAIRIAASMALRNCIENWDFDAADFSPFLEQFLQNLLELVSQVEESETQLLMVSVLSSVVERMTDYILPFTTSLIVPKLPIIWETSQNSSLLKGSLVQLLRSIVEVSVMILVFLIPMILMINY